jgi:hypothetical protein
VRNSFFAINSRREFLRKSGKVLVVTSFAGSFLTPIGNLFIDEALGANYCANCGAELPKNAKFCPKCGMKIESGEIDKTNTGESNESNWKEVPCECKSRTPTFFEFCHDVIECSGYLSNPYEYSQLKFKGETGNKTVLGTNPQGYPTRKDLPYTTDFYVENIYCPKGEGFKIEISVPVIKHIETHNLDSEDWIYYYMPHGSPNGDIFLTIYTTEGSGPWSFKIRE